jgi:hypothetical protein
MNQDNTRDEKYLKIIIKTEQLSDELERIDTAISYLEDKLEVNKNIQCKLKTKIKRFNHLYYYLASKEDYEIECYEEEETELEAMDISKEEERFDIDDILHTIKQKKKRMNFEA